MNLNNYKKPLFALETIEPRVLLSFTTPLETGNDVCFQEVEITSSKDSPTIFIEGELGCSAYRMEGVSCKSIFSENHYQPSFSWDGAKAFVLDYLETFEQGMTCPASMNNLEASMFVGEQVVNAGRSLLENYGPDVSRAAKQGFEYTKQHPWEMGLGLLGGTLNAITVHNIAGQSLEENAVGADDTSKNNNLGISSSSPGSSHSAKNKFASKSAPNVNFKKQKLNKSASTTSVIEHQLLDSFKNFGRQSVRDLRDFKNDWVEHMEAGILAEVQSANLYRTEMAEAGAKNAAFANAMGVGAISKAGLGIYDWANSEGQSIEEVAYSYAGGFLGGHIATQLIKPSLGYLPLVNHFVSTNANNAATPFGEFAQRCIIDPQAAYNGYKTYSQIGQQIDNEGVEPFLNRIWQTFLEHPAEFALGKGMKLFSDMLAATVLKKMFAGTIGIPGGRTVGWILAMPTAWFIKDGIGPVAVDVAKNIGSFFENCYKAWKNPKKESDLLLINNETANPLSNPIPFYPKENLPLMLTAESLPLSGQGSAPITPELTYFNPKNTFCSITNYTTPFSVSFDNHPNLLFCDRSESISSSLELYPAVQLKNESVQINASLDDSLVINNELEEVEQIEVEESITPIAEVLVQKPTLEDLKLTSQGLIQSIDGLTDAAAKTQEGLQQRLMLIETLESLALMQVEEGKDLDAKHTTVSIHARYAEFYALSAKAALEKKEFDESHNLAKKAIENREIASALLVDLKLNKQSLKQIEWAAWPKRMLAEATKQLVKVASNKELEINVLAKQADALGERRSYTEAGVEIRSSLINELHSLHAEYLRLDQPDLANLIFLQLNAREAELAAIQSKMNLDKNNCLVSYDLAQKAINSRLSASQVASKLGDHKMAANQASWSSWPSKLADKAKACVVEQLNGSKEELFKQAKTIDRMGEKKAYSKEGVLLRENLINKVIALHIKYENIDSEENIRALGFMLNARLGELNAIKAKLALDEGNQELAYGYATTAIEHRESAALIAEKMGSTSDAASQRSFANWPKKLADRAIAGR